MELSLLPSGSGLFVLSLGGKKHYKKSYGYKCMNHRTGACDVWNIRNARIVELAFFSEYMQNLSKLDSQNSELNIKLEAVKTRIANLNKAVANLYDLAEQGDTEAKSRISKRKGEIADCENQLSVLSASIVEQGELPTALQELEHTLEWDEYCKAIDEFVPKLEKTLADNETRKKLTQLLPVLFAKVVFDNENFTLQPFTKNGEPLRKINLHTFED